MLAFGQGSVCWNLSPVEWPMHAYTAVVYQARPISFAHCKLCKQCFPMA